MTSILDVANAVVAALVEEGAELSIAPDFELDELTQAKVLVVPVSREVVPKSRAVCEVLYKIEVGVLKRVKSADVSECVTLCEGLGHGLLRQTFADCVATGVEFPTLCDPEALRSRNLFIGVVMLNLKGVESW